MSVDWIESLITIWSGALCRASVQAALGILVLLLIERAVPWLAAAWRSWLWRLLYLKIAIVLFVPIAWNIPVLPSLEDSTTAGDRSKIAPSTSTVVMESIESAAHASSTEAAVPRTTRASWFSMIAFGVWGACLFTQFVFLTMQWVRVQSLLKRASTRFHPAIGCLLRNVCAQMRASRVPKLLMVEGIRSPMVVGYVEPRILWPETIAERGQASRSESEDRRMALAHEIAHLLRWDLLWNLLVAAVNAVLWFHPLLWLAGRRYLAAQEAACDELAVRRAHLDRSRFADLLIRVSQNTGLCDWNPAGVPLIQGHGIDLLRERLKTMQRSRSDRVGQTAAVAALALGLVLAVLPWSIGAAEPRSASGSKRIPQNTTESSDGIKVSASASSSSSGSGFASGSGSSGGSSRSGSSGGGQSGGNSFGKAGGSSSSSANSSVSLSIGGGSSSSSSPTAVGNSFAPRTGSGKKSNSSSNTNGAQVTTSREVTEDGEEIRVTVQEKLRDIQLRQSEEDGIEVFIRPSKKNPDQTVTNVTAATAEELKEKNPQAYEVYRKYLLDKLDKIRASAATLAKPPTNAADDETTELNPAQQLMAKKLRELLQNEDLPAANRAQIEQMLNELK